MTAPVVLQAEAITVRLGGRTVLHDVGLEVGRGEIVGVFGPSGAGKSTLFRALAGEETLVAGRIAVEGVDVTALPLWRRARLGLGYVPQTPSVLWDLTVDENMAVFRDLARSSTSKKQGEPMHERLLAELGLDGRGGVPAGALSGGERRRLELARALLVEPKVLLCDEPFAAIDPHGTSRVGDQLRGLAERGTAVLIADHNVSEALKLCHRATLLLGGEAVLVATPDEFRRHDRVRRHYVVIEEGLDPPETLPTD